MNFPDLINEIAENPISKESLISGWWRVNMWKQAEDSFFQGSDCSRQLYNQACKTGFHMQRNSTVNKTEMIELVNTWDKNRIG
jgi:hypothetical protein